MFMNCRFYNEKIENIPEMNLGKFDFIESTGTGCLSSLHTCTGCLSSLQGYTWLFIESRCTGSLSRLQVQGFYRVYKDIHGCLSSLTAEGI